MARVANGWVGEEEDAAEGTSAGVVTEEFLEESAKFVAPLWEAVDVTETPLSTSIICAPGGTVDFAFPLFRLQLSLMSLLSPILRFEGLAPGTIKIMKTFHEGEM